jgi:ubiquinone/menaquinone biosynthesis C-methylase UbiE
MGFFTLPLAQMVGSDGKVVAVDIQAEMLTTLKRRARRRGLLDRIELRTASSDGLGVADLRASVDFCAALHVAHEVPDQTRFFGDIATALKTGARLLVIEPRGHVSAGDFELSISTAEVSGFRRIETPHLRGSRQALFERTGA